MSIKKYASIIALTSLIGSFIGSAGIASAQVAPGCTPPNSYLQDGMCVPYYPYPGHGQVVNGQSVVSGPATGTNTAGGTVLGASTTQPNLPTVDETGRAAVQVIISDNGFAPSAIAVSPGTTVMWVNNGSSSHTIQGTNSVFGTTLQSGLVPPNGSFTMVFQDPGTFNYHDTVNGSTMAGTVVVVPNGQSANTGSGSVLGASTTQPNLPNTGATSGSAATTLNAMNTGQRVVQVGVFDNFFDPHNVVIPTGGTVTWTNRGSAAHTVQADDGTFSATLAPNGTFSHIFNTAGTYLYYDRTSGGRGGTGMFGVVVVENPAAGTNNGSGSVLGASTANPNLPNTGMGGMAGANELVLGLTATMMLLGTYLLVRRRFGLL